jgi:hypothetical protein
MGLFDFFRRKKKKDNRCSEQHNKTSSNDKRSTFEDVFPNGIKDVIIGAAELRRILNNKIDITTAQSIFVRSSSICFSCNVMNPFTKERLRLHLAPYALHYFDEAALDEFYNYLCSNRNVKSGYNALLKQAREYAQLIGGEYATDADVMPEGVGEFGLEISNPIPVCSIPDSANYLRRLRTADGTSITYKRIGSTRVSNIKQIIDGYRIFVNGQQIAIIYICPYNKKNSLKAPKGFVLIDDES